MFYLEDDFVLSFADASVAWGPVGEVTYYRTYSRDLESTNERIWELGTKHGLKKEQWWLTVCRVVEAIYGKQKQHCAELRLPWDEAKAQYSAKVMYRKIFNFKFLPPGRGLWSLGTIIAQKTGAALQNCAFVSTQDLRTDFAGPFTFLMDMSMLGVGVGFDTYGSCSQVRIRNPEIVNERYTVGDSREGWVALVRRMLNAYIGKSTIPDFIDFSEVRPAGVPIRGFGGISSGPGPLLQLTDDIKEILGKLVGKTISETAIVDLGNAIGRCVVSGGVRRSAEIVFGPPDSQTFLALKTPGSHRMATWGWVSNNSVFAYKGMDYARCVASTIENGEPGFLWLDNCRKYGRMRDLPTDRDALVCGTNPCGEQPLESYELCTLVETFPAHHVSLAEYEETLKYAYLYAKTITLWSTHEPRTNAVMLRNRRIGCSMSGVSQAISKFGLRTFFTMADKGYAYLKHVDQVYSRWLCIPESVKITSIKPSGTVSLLCGATPGIHYDYASDYYRTIRFQNDDPLTDAHKRANYRVEQSVTEPNTSVVYFPVTGSSGSRRNRADVGIWEQFQLASAMQHYWADNAVSCTVTFRPDEGKDLVHALQHYEDKLKSISCLPLADHTYEQAPYQPAPAEELRDYKSRLQNVSFADSVHSAEDRFCDGPVCEIPLKGTNQ